MDKTILHIDFDSFFASVEQQDNPLFRDRPLGVTATNGRNCIIAASREAKACGIKSPSRVHEARRICPSLLVTGAHFSRYFGVSKQFLSICKDYSPFVEMFSIDELFMDVTKTIHLFHTTETIIAEIKRRLARDVGPLITVSIGVSYNKMLAKLASGLNKPNGMCSITPDNREAVYQQAKLTDICGIGSRIADRLANMGIRSLLQLEQVSLTSLTAEFGQQEGIFLKNVGLGIDTAEIIPYTTLPSVKSVGRNYCLPQNEYNERVVLQNIYELCEEVGIKLRRLGKKARTVGLGLRGSRSDHGRLTTGHYINQGKDIFRVCKYLYDNWQSVIPSEGHRMVRMISVWTGNLTDQTLVPFSLFEETPRSSSLAKTIDTLNDRFGDHTIRNGFLLYADKLTTVPNGWMGDRYERTKLATS